MMMFKEDQFFDINVSENDDENSQRIVVEIEDERSLETAAAAQHRRVEEMKELYYLGIDLNRTPPESPIFLKLNKRSCDEADTHIAKKKKTSEEHKSLSPTINRVYSPQSKNKENAMKSTTKKIKVNPLSPYNGGNMKNIRSTLTKQKPHYFIKNQENGTITASPFKLPLSSSTVKLHNLPPSCPCSPEISHILNRSSDRMRMPPPPSPSSTPSNLPSPFRSPSPNERFTLDSPLLRRPPTTPKYSPVVNSLFTESPTTGKEWQISDYYFNSEDSSENDEKEEERNYKYWCKRKNLEKILEKQATIDADEVFGPPYTTCDLEELFQKTRSHYKRSDRQSGCWSASESEVNSLDD
jgi:hypothetical protein